MIKLVFCLRRLPHLSLEEFQRYWREVHAPLVQRHAAALRILRYVQTHTAASPLNDVLRDSRGAGAAYDGVAELWWRDEAELLAALGSEAGREASAALLEDERRFIALPGSALWLAAEHPVVG